MVIARALRGDSRVALCYRIAVCNTRVRVERGFGGLERVGRGCRYGGNRVGTQLEIAYAEMVQRNGARQAKYGGNGGDGCTSGVGGYTCAFVGICQRAFYGVGVFALHAGVFRDSRRFGLPVAAKNGHEDV